MNRVNYSSRGVVTVEFALVAWVMVMMVFGITELGRALYQLNTLTKATISGARYLARLDQPLDNTSCSGGTAWSNGDIDNATNLVLYGSEAPPDGAETLLPGMTVSFSCACRSLNDTDLGIATEGCVITAESGADFTSLFGDPGPIIPFTDIDTFRMEQTVEERYIGE